MHKFGIIKENDIDHPYQYGDIWCVEKTTETERLAIAPDTDQINWMIELAKQWETDEFYLLYVLVVSRLGKEPGRYQCPNRLSFSDLVNFLRKFTIFFETDGRHHLWIGTPNNQNLIVYDRHNVIYAYGPLNKYENILRKANFIQKKIIFPDPHSHRYNQENDKEEEELLNYFDWLFSPLQKND